MAGAAEPEPVNVLAVENDSGDALTIAELFSRPAVPRRPGVAGDGEQRASRALSMARHQKLDAARLAPAEVIEA